MCVCFAVYLVISRSHYEHTYRYTQTWVHGERVDVVNLKIVSRRFLSPTFHITILREQYRQLESFVARIRSAQATIAKQRSSIFLGRFVEELKRECNHRTLCSVIITRKKIEKKTPDTQNKIVQTKYRKATGGDSNKKYERFRVSGCLWTCCQCKDCEAMSNLYGAHTLSLHTELVSSMYFKMVD